jgi:hypothetical protein
MGDAMTAVKKLTSKRGENHLYLVPNVDGHPIELTRADVVDLSTITVPSKWDGHYASILAAIDAMEAGS